VVIDNQIAMIILMLCLWAAKPRWFWASFMADFLLMRRLIPSWWRLFEVVGDGLVVAGKGRGFIGSITDSRSLWSWNRWIGRWWRNNQTIRIL
jgi:hypothetical protein